jgi:NADH-quinone oxidoreductase subunit A
MSRYPQSDVWPLVLYFAAIIVLVGAMIGISALLGPKHREMATDDPYESGIVGVGSARLRFPVKFYLVALFFVIFDMEAVYLFAWAIAFRDLGWVGYAGALAFIATVAAALVYLWGLGALDWGPSRRGSEK